MEKKIIEILQKIFEDTDITESSSQDNIPEWDSMKQLNIAFEIENEFGIELEPEEIASLKSVTAIIKCLKNKQHL